MSVRLRYKQDIGKRKGEKKMSIIQIGSLEIFKQNRYYPTDIGLVSDNAYLSFKVNKLRFVIYLTDMHLK
jgi:hypothetical protein